MRVLGLCFFVSLLLFSKEDPLHFYSVKLKPGINSEQVSTELARLRDELRTLGFVITMTVGTSVLIEVANASDINKLAGATFHGGYSPSKSTVERASSQAETNADSSNNGFMKLRVFPSNDDKETAKARLEAMGIRVLEGGGHYSLVVEASPSEQRTISSWGWNISDHQDIPQWMQAQQRSSAARRCSAAIRTY